jgi:hypothetical protein
MKKVVFTLLIALAGLTMTANTGIGSSIDLAQNGCEEDQVALLAIEIRSETSTQNFEFNFTSEAELLNFNEDAISEMIDIIDANDAFCQVSITVKVRLGVDSNFVEASATVSGIPCGEIVKAIKKLRAQLMEGIR